MVARVEAPSMALREAAAVGVLAAMLLAPDQAAQVVGVVAEAVLLERAMLVPVAAAVEEAPQPAPVVVEVVEVEAAVVRPVALVMPVVVELVVEVATLLAQAVAVVVLVVAAVEAQLAQAMLVVAAVVAREAAPVVLAVLVVVATAVVAVAQQVAVMQEEVVPVEEEEVQRVLEMLVLVAVAAPEAAHNAQGFRSCTLNPTQAQVRQLDVLKLTAVTPWLHYCCPKQDRSRLEGNKLNSISTTASNWLVFLLIPRGKPMLAAKLKRDLLPWTFRAHWLN